MEEEILEKKKLYEFIRAEVERAKEDVVVSVRAEKKMEQGDKDKEQSDIGNIIGLVGRYWRYDEMTRVLDEKVREVREKIVELKDDIVNNKGREVKLWLKKLFDNDHWRDIASALLVQNGKLEKIEGYKNRVEKLLHLSVKEINTSVTVADKTQRDDAIVIGKGRFGARAFVRASYDRTMWRRVAMRADEVIEGMKGVRRLKPKMERLERFLKLLQQFYYLETVLENHMSFNVDGGSIFVFRSYGHVCVKVRYNDFYVLRVNPEGDPYDENNATYLKYADKLVAVSGMVQEVKERLIFQEAAIKRINLLMGGMEKALSRELMFAEI